MKKIAILALSVVLVAMLGIGATTAWFTHEDSVKNTVTMGNIKIDLIEPHFNGGCSNTVTNILPNKFVCKDPTVKNIGTNKALVCIKIDTNLIKPNPEVNDNSKIQSNQTIYDMFKLNKDWVRYGNTNIFCYTKALEPGQSTTALFNGITIPYQWQREQCIYTENGVEKTKSLIIDIKAYAIQAENYIIDSGYTGPSFAPKATGEDSIIADEAVFDSINWNTVLDADVLAELKGANAAA